MKSKYEECIEDSWEYTCLKFYEFSAIDYVVFTLMLVVSASVGVYFAYRSRRQESIEEFTLGGRDMHAVPTSVSVMCTTLSAITIIGTPAEFYNFGAMYFWMIVVYIVSMTIAAEVYIPIFYKLGIRSTYEYLELRFNSTLRVVTMYLFMIAGLFTTGIAIYAPATALSAVTAMDLNLAILSTGIVCIFYTSIGGMKAVVWTDVIQSTWMVSGLFAVTVYAGNEIGFDYIWQRANESGRTDFFVSSWDPTVRNSLQSVILGNVFGLNAYSFCVSQVYFT